MEDAVWAHAIGGVGVGPAGGREGHRPVGPMVPNDRVGISEIDQAVLELFVEAVDHADPAARFARHVEDDIGTHGGTEHDQSAVGSVRGDRLAVEGNDDRLVVLEIEPEYSGVRAVDEPQADALAPLHPADVRYRPEEHTSELQ